MSEGLTALSTRVADMPLRPPVVVDPHESIADTARRMAEADTESVVAVDRDGRPVGILTDSDLRRRVLARALDISGPVAPLLSSPVVTIRRSAAGYEAVIAMLEGRIHHLVVVDEAGRATGALADSDLLGLEASGPIALARRIERAGSVDELAAARASYPATLRTLLGSGATARTVLAVLAEANDRVQQRLVKLATEELGPAPAPFAWMVMGSEGRRTQTLRTDQDNGIAWADEEADPGYFAAFAEWVVSALARTGLPKCTGDVMATNPLWRGPLRSWKERFATWIGEPEPTALLRSLIAFDLRAVAGDVTIADDLRVWLMARTPHARLLLVHLAREALRRSPPLGPLGRISLDRQGGFDAKLGAIGIVVDAARLLALELGLTTTSTMERLAQAGAAGAIPTEDAAEAAAAYDALQLMRLRRQADAAASGMPPDNRIVPRELGRADRAALREHLAAIGRLQRGIAERYGAAVSVS